MGVARRQAFGEVRRRDADPLALQRFVAHHRDGNLDARRVLQLRRRDGVQARLQLPQRRQELRPRAWAHVRVARVICSIARLAEHSAPGSGTVAQYDRRQKPGLTPLHTHCNGQPPDITLLMSS